MRNKEKRQKHLLIALEEEHDNVSAACKRVGVSRDTFYAWRNGDKLFREQYLGVQERLLSKVDTILLDRALNKRSTKALIALAERTLDNIEDLKNIEGLKSLHMAKVARHGNRYQ